jgi:Ca-activated chloride channel family protein
MRIRRSILLLLCAAALLPAATLRSRKPSAAGDSAPLPQDVRFAVKVELVSLYATVLNRNGKVVGDLTQEDFLVYDNGEPQAITQFSREYVPLSVVILLDTSSSMAGKKLDHAKKSLGHFLKRLNPGDEALLMAFNSRPVLLQGFTRDLDRIRRALGRLEAIGSTALYDAVLQGLQEARKAQNRRSALLLVSDGINTYGSAELQGTISLLRRSAAQLFAIGIESDLPEEMQYRPASRAVLEQLTASAGGEAFIVLQPKELGDVCAEISERMHHQYAFAYDPPQTGGGQWRDVRIEARISGLRVVASKRGYYSR